MEKKICNIELIQFGDEKTTEGLPKEIAIRLGRLELSLTLNGIYAVSDKKNDHDSKESIVKALESGEQLIDVVTEFLKTQFSD
ncbi:hypothetical protein [Lactobacillus phage JNU_P2]|nr:hypothetical protein [Lactobacillus phage JNU_P2]QHJ74912.1 hypothetical protein [Lactobacillus phage JNU_P4]